MAERPQQQAIGMPGGGFLFPSQPAPVPGPVRSLVRRVSALLRKNPEMPMQPELPSGPTTETGAVSAFFNGLVDQLWQVQQDRRSIWFDLREMDLNDAVISTALNIIADCVTGYEDATEDAFEWQLEKKNPEALAILQDMKERLSLGSESWQIVRHFVQYGEEYREIVLNDDLQVVRYKPLPAYTIMPNFDDLGNRRPGWKQTRDGYTDLGAREFEEWQIQDYQFGPKRGYGYFGTGLMVPARRSWRRYQKLTDGMAIARMLRAYDRTVYKVPVKAEWDFMKQSETVANFVNKMIFRRAVDSEGKLAKQNDPFAVGTDIFLPDDGTKRGDVQLLQSQNMQLMNVEDVRFHQDEILACLRVPRKYLNLSSGARSALNEAGLTAEDVQFSRTLRQAQATFRAGMIELAKFQLFLQGYMPADLGVKVKMSRISTHDHLQNAKVQFTMAQAAALFDQTVFQGGLPPELVGRKFMELSDEDLVTFVKFVESREAERERLRSTGGVSAPGVATPPSDAPAVKQIAQALTHLEMLCQVEAERLGVKFDLGYPERLEHNHDAVLAALAKANGAYSWR